MPTRLIDRRRAAASKRLGRLRQRLSTSDRLVQGKACLYVTGSFGRMEAGRHSDLDLFIVGRDVEGKRTLTNLDEVMVKADLIEQTRRLEFPEFSGDGEYLRHYTVHELVNTLGRPDDDALNTFTARLLLLLESRPLIGERVYAEAIRKVINAYWRDYEGREAEFCPAYLANDILRLWRTFCVNYEARTQSDPPGRKAKRKLKNYKLKHSRLLTCYSALAFLLVYFTEKGTVSPRAAARMVRLSPTERLQWIGRRQKYSELVGQVLSRYEQFLRETDASEEEMIRRFRNRATARKYSLSAGELGERVFELLNAAGSENAFLWLLVV